MTRRNRPRRATPTASSVADSLHARSPEPLRDLFVVSFAALFFQALLVRWIPTSIYYLGYFKNCMLIATFLGFGIGCATHRRVERVLPAFTLLCSVMVLAVVLSERHVSIIPWETGEFFWGLPKRGVVTVSMHVSLIAAFVVAALLMIPLGRLVGLHLSRHPPLLAYSVNLIASVLGVAAFLLVSFLELGPDVWFVCGLLPLVYVLRSRPRAVLATLAGIVLIVGMVRIAGSARAFWSPYHKIILEPLIYTDVNARALTTNNAVHQVLYDLSAERLARRPPGEDKVWGQVEDHLYIYESAYSVLKPRSVLIVGGGTGNEAAAALRQGAAKVDVVEIDPVIIELGRRHHPERPYHDSRVNVFNDDARHYMATATQRYDLIVFGFLDSTSQLSSLSNIRLDNYVYTMESFRRARELLRPGGLLQVTYFAWAPFVHSRIYEMLRHVFGEAPLIFKRAEKAGDCIYFAGPAVAGGRLIRVPGMTQMAMLEESGRSHLPTDDWPFMNLPDREIGRDYLIALVLMAILSALGVGAFVGTRGSTVPPAERLVLFFLLGAAFMLLETCTIMRMALLLGSTWIVTQAAIIVVLLASLVATQLVLRYRSPTRAHGLALLLAGATLNYLIPMETYQSLGPFRVLAGAGAAYLPVLGSSIVFSRVFADSRQSNVELGFNIFGAVFGGVLEYGSLMVGIRSLYLVVVVIFLLVGLIVLRQRSPKRRGREASAEV